MNLQRIVRRYVPVSVAGAVLAILTLASGCSGSTSGGLADRASGPRVGSAAAMLAQVRAAGTLGVELDVQPLRDPQVEDLRASASTAEARGDYAGANRALTMALALSPNDPELLQWQAEMALAQRDWTRASQLATQSFERGPKLGGLCRRNWTTVRLAAEARGDAVAAGQAQQRISTCTVAPPTRL